MSAAHGLNIGVIFLYGDNNANGEADGIIGEINPTGVPENSVLLYDGVHIEGVSIDISSNGCGFGKFSGCCCCGGVCG